MTVLAIHAGTLIDGTGGVPGRQVTIVVEGGRIRRIVPRQAAHLPPEVEIIDAGESTVMPGMIDCHLHIHAQGGPAPSYDFFLDPVTQLQGTLALRAYAHARHDLAMGFTTLRSLMSPGYVDIALRDAVNSGVVEGPRLQVAGEGICITGGHMDLARCVPEVAVPGRTGVADGPWECRKAAREQLKRGADVIKINAVDTNLDDLDAPWRPEMTLEEMAAVCDEAHRAGKRVAAHAHGGQGLTDAILAGVDSVEHAPWLSVEQADLMAERGVFYVPTLAVHSRGLALGQEGSGQPDAGWAWLQRVCVVRWESLARARRAGVKIAAGTDCGFWLRHGENALELEELVRGGMTPMEAIAAATRVGAECLGIASDVGTVEPGKCADLVIIDGDPLADIRVLQDRCHIAAVFRAGRRAG